MKPHDAVTLKIHRNGSTTQLYFQIVDTKNKPLLSPDTCERLGLLKVTINETAAVNTVVTEQDKLRVPLTREAILKEYKDVFKGLGHIGFSSSFVVNPDLTPVQHALRRVAVTLQKLRSQRENCRDGEERNHTEGDRADRMDQKHGCSSKTRKNRICLDPRDLNKAIQRCQLKRKYGLDSAKPKFLQPSILKIVSIRLGWTKLVARKQLSGLHLADTDISECHLVSA